MNQILQLLENETDGKCYRSYRYCADIELKVPSVNYQDGQNFTVLKDRYGETDTTLVKTKDIGPFASKISDQSPLFKFFLDGSRRTYKVDDIELNRRIFPIMAGQVGVACCERISPAKFKPKEVSRSLVLALPSEANPEIRNSDLFFNNLRDKINSTEKVKRSGVQFSKILSYKSTQVEATGDIEANKFEHRGIAMIHDEMIDSEKKIVASLTAKNLLNESSFLLKDGSLQYKPMKSGDYKELTKIKNNYRRVIGVSKSFNPELCKDRRNQSNAAAIANLPLYHRTPAYMFQHEREKQAHLGDYTFSIWYVRIRDVRKTESPFAGVIKIEKILVTEKEIEFGLDSDLVDIITANIINERNPVCYGNDKRWANHLYPVYLTEQYLKSNYLSDLHFLNLF